MRDEAVASLRALNEVVERLRAPGGCPWDREQSHRSLRPYLLEETYELLEAVESGDPAMLREELGDVLLQVLMHTAIAAEEAQGFDLGDVAETTRAKMIHRHPHVFGDTAVDGADQVVVNWERLKRSEKGERLSLLDGIPRALPALAFAQGIQKRPARLGFDETPSTEEALDHLRETLDEVARRAVTQPAPRRGEDWTVTEGEIRPPAAAGAGHAPGAPPAPPSLEAAVGELLFAAVALARRLRVNPEDALRARTTGYAERFRALERRARADGVDLHDLDGEEWRRRWGQAETPGLTRH
jgi:MazG family protein